MTFYFGFLPVADKPSLAWLPTKGHCSLFCVEPTSDFVFELVVCIIKVSPFGRLLRSAGYTGSLFFLKGQKPLPGTPTGYQYCFTFVVLKHIFRLVCLFVGLV